MGEFLQRVESDIRDRRLLARGQKILVAVSGGADSMVLLHILARLAQKNRLEILVAHFNHQLRGRSSDADESLVRSVTATLKLPFVAGRRDVKRLAKTSKLSVEMAARKLRHEFFARVARARKISAVALAHHADDQVELFFLRILRGAGGDGVAGMKWRAPSPADSKVNIIRPLLGFSKAEILAFARANKISFRDDATNFSNDFLRNRVRNELLPLLRKNYQPGLAQTVLRLMEIVGAEAEAVGQLAGSWRKRRKPAFEDLSVAVQRRVVQLQLAQLNVVADFDLVEQLREPAEKFVSVGPGLSVSRNAGGGLKLREPQAMAFNRNARKLNLRGGAGDAEFGGAGLSWRFEANKKKLPVQKSGREFFDADKIGGEITLRHWRAGDRFQPIGLKSSAKLQDLFTNAKIPAAVRRDLIVAASGGEIFWVEGLRISENFKLTAETRRRLAWRWRRPAGLPAKTISGGG